jgi:hypothetical protein
VWKSGNLRDKRMNRDVSELSEYMLYSGFAKVSVW